jgi:hypothetical protein
MTPEQRKRMIFESLYSDQTGLLRRYTAPEHLSAERQRAEIMYMVDDLAEELPDLPEAELAALLEAMHSHVRRNSHGRMWPTISDLVKASRKVAGLGTSDAGTGDVDKLTPAQKGKLAEVLASATRWLGIPGLAAHGQKTLDYWGQK